MTGMLYKDLRTNSRWVKIILLILIFFNVVMSFMLCIGDDDIGATKNKLFMTLFFGGSAAISFMVVGAFALNFVQTDERKKWGCYVTAVPNGIAKQVVAKYIFVALSVLLTLVICGITNLVTRSQIETAPDISGIIITLAAISLIMRSVELPCITAFGTKIGTQVKGGLMAVIILAVLIYGLFGDLSWIGSEDDFWESFFRLIQDLDFNRLSLILLAAAVPLYCISCFISTKLFLGGIERLDK